MDKPLKARLAKLPPLPSFPEDQTQDDTTDTSTETDSSTASIQTVVPVQSRYSTPLNEVDDAKSSFRTNIMDELFC
jgi:hypothetical protein